MLTWHAAQLPSIGSGNGGGGGGCVAAVVVVGGGVGQAMAFIHGICCVRISSAQSVFCKETQKTRPQRERKLEDAPLARVFAFVCRRFRSLTSRPTIRATRRTLVHRRAQAVASAALWRRRSFRERRRIGNSKRLADICMCVVGRCRN